MSKTTKEDYKQIAADMRLIAKIKGYYDLCVSYYAKDHRRMRLLDATDRGDLWKALAAKFPPYQILPDTNFVSYVKNNLLASIYTVAKSADILPTSKKDMALIQWLNIAMSSIWGLAKVGLYQFQAGERAALLNLGITQIGWDDELTGGSGDAFYKGNITLKNIDPMKFMRDPFATDLEHSGYCMTYDSYHRSVFLENPNYRRAFREFEAKSKDSGINTPLPEYAEQSNRPKGAAKDYYNLLIIWIKEGDRINEYHVVNESYILYRKEDIRPKAFPFALLYCNLPSGALIGTSEPAKIFANNVAYNLMDSIALTAEYKNQRPPKFISSQSGLNVRSFAKHGDDADKTFVVNGDATRAVHYHQFPQVSPIITNLKMGLMKDSQMVSGVDGRYTGRDTGSIITTGGTEEMLARVTLIDTPKILMYEEYASQLTRLVLSNFLEYAPKRTYFYKKPNTTRWESLTVDFPKIDADTLFNYEIDISSELPKNKQRIAGVANMLMEQQMQYQQEGSSVQLITEEEWLMFQDLPNKEFMLERMGLQRMEDSLEETSQILFQYADLVKKGMSPDDAIVATAKSLKDKRTGMMTDSTGDTLPMMAPNSSMPPQGMPQGMPPGVPQSPLE